MKKIGILGGTFNPVHNGHLAIARQALSGFKLDEVWFVPCSRPPHKPAGDLAPARDRVAMLALALKNSPRCRIWEAELDRGGASYTVDTVRELEERLPDAELYLIIGADNLKEIAGWKEPGELVRLCRFVVVSRPGFSLDDLDGENRRWAERIIEKDRANVLKLSLPVFSSEVRRRIRKGEDLVGLVPPAVADYISEKGLYDQSLRVKRRGGAN